MSFPDGWGWRIKLTSDNTKVSASIKGLAIDLSNIASADFWGNVKSDGSDIRITTDEAGTSLVARDVISIDTTAETGLIRLDTSGISTSADTDYYVWYGNASATEPAAGDTYGQYNTYDSGLVGYWVGGSGSTFTDRSQNQHHGTLDGATFESSETFLGIPAVDLTSTDRITFPNMDSLFGTNGTFIPWLRRLQNTPPPNNDKRGSWLFYDTSMDDSHYPWSNGSIYESTFRTSRANDISDSGFDKTQLHRLLVKSSAVANGWVLKQNNITRRTENGQSFTTVGGSSTQFGYTGSRYWEGYLYSLMLFSIKLTDNEDETMYNNESDNASFWAFGTPEETAAPVGGRPLKLLRGL